MSEEQESVDMESRQAEQERLEEEKEMEGDSVNEEHYD